MGGILDAGRGLFSNTFFFARFPITRDVPWANFLIFAIVVILLHLGLKQVLSGSTALRTKITAGVLGVLSLGIIGLFSFMVFYQSRQLPAAMGSPQVGSKAPDFELRDTNNQVVTLAGLLSVPIQGTETPPKGVLLVFYRGYW